jgi:hypothetical protein
MDIQAAVERTNAWSDRERVVLRAALVVHALPAFGKSKSVASDPSAHLVP